jgi:hypothetical protein
MNSKHPGFKRVQQHISQQMGVNMADAGKILGKRTREASPEAKKKNPRLKRVKGSLVIAFLLITQPLLAAQVNLTWRDNSTNEKGFNIQRKLFAEPVTAYSNIATTGPNTAAFIDSTVQVGVVYCYRVNAFNDSGISPWSPEACMLATPDGLVIVYTP